MWLVFSLPIVTIGASTIAACSVTLHMAEDTEGHAAKDFLKAFKANIKQGIPMTFITLICVWAVYLDFQIYGAEADMGSQRRTYLPDNRHRGGIYLCIFPAVCVSVAGKI
ncbi:MAG: YesL family protein [Ruminococcus sp.]|nr:MAG: YesL family protein [Ruminococcus sp.]